MDYATLVKTVKTYLENDFPATLSTNGLTSTEQLNTFIQQAEERIYNSVQALATRKSVTGTMTASNQYLTVPTDWLSTFELAVIDGTTGEYSYLLNKDVNFIREAFPIPTVTGKPTHYASFDKSSILLGLTPDLSYSTEMHYYAYPTSIVSAGNTWLGDNFSSVLLYGAMLEAYTLMEGEEDLMKVYESRYGQALAMLKQHTDGKNRQDMYRTPQVRYPVQ